MPHTRPSSTQLHLQIPPQIPALLSLQLHNPIHRLHRPHDRHIRLIKELDCDIPRAPARQRQPVIAWRLEHAHRFQAGRTSLQEFSQLHGADFEVGGRAFGTIELGEVREAADVCEVVFEERVKGPGLAMGIGPLVERALQVGGGGYDGLPELADALHDQ